MDAVFPYIAARVESGANEVLLLTLDDRLPTDNSSQRCLRSATQRLLTDASLTTIRETFFLIEREEFSKRLGDTTVQDIKEFYKSCRSAYGDNCHVSVLGLRDAVKNSFQAVFRQHEPEIFLSLPRQIQQPLTNRRRHVYHRLIQRSD